MSDQITITVSRVTKGRDWADHQQQDAADLEAQLREHAERNGLFVADISDVTIHRSDSGSWARLVRTATAHPQRRQT